MMKTAAFPTERKGTPPSEALAKEEKGEEEGGGGGEERRGENSQPQNIAAHSFA